MLYESKRAAFTLPKPVLSDLSYVCLRLGTNKSQFVASLLAEPLALMRQSLYSVSNSLHEMTPEESENLVRSLSSSLDQSVADAFEAKAQLHSGDSNG